MLLVVASRIISPIIFRVLNIVIKNEEIDIMNDVEIALPWYVIGLDDGHFFHSLVPDREQDKPSTASLLSCLYNMIDREFIVTMMALS